MQNIVSFIVLTKTARLLKKRQDNKAMNKPTGRVAVNRSITVTQTKTVMCIVRLEKAYFIYIQNEWRCLDLSNA